MWGDGATTESAAYSKCSVDARSRYPRGSKVEAAWLSGESTGFEPGEPDLEAHQRGEGKQGKHHERGPVQVNLRISPCVGRGRRSYGPCVIITCLRHYGASSGPGAAPRRLRRSAYLIFTAAGGGEFYSHPHFADRKTETEK